MLRTRGYEIFNISNNTGRTHFHIASISYLCEIAFLGIYDNYVEVLSRYIKNTMKQ